MISRGPNYYFETLFHHIEQEIAEKNPALILVTPADWKVIRASIPKQQRTITTDAQGRPWELIWKDDDGIERTFRRVPPEDPPSGILDLTERTTEEL